MPHRFVHSNLAVLRQAFQLLAGVAQLFTLLWREAGQEPHALQGLFASFRWKAVEFSEALADFVLPFRWQPLESRIVFQCFHLLVRRKIFVGLEPVAHLSSALLPAAFAGVGILLRGAGLKGDDGYPVRAARVGERWRGCDQHS